uniref:Cation/H+ exchanger domain-containing protein n=1 Tax=Oxyrrhis marina TaxID=2969 RepID=A0A7S4LNG8_OXYMA
MAAAPAKVTWTDTLYDVYYNLAMLGMFFLVMYVMLWPGCYRNENATPEEKADCQHPGLPGGEVFDVVEVLFFGTVGGRIVSQVFRLPALLGMLIAGYVLKNIIPDQLNGISSSTNSTLRNMALAIIMIRAGMGLDLKKLRENASMMGVLSCVPCICEALTVMGITQLFFDSYNLTFGLLLGFCLADVSPAVTTPLLIDFHENGYGTSKGIPTILLAAGSVNSVLAIVFYSVVWEFAMSGTLDGEKLGEIIGVKLFVQIFGVGVGAGLAAGVVVSYSWTAAGKAWKRFMLMFLVAMALLFGFKRIGHGGGGTLAVLTFGATVQHLKRAETGIDSTAAVSSIIGYLWSNVGSIMLFTLLGASVDQTKLDGKIVGFGFLTVLIGLVGRCIATWLSAMPLREWTFKEKCFTMVTWCPKATVQAALATHALDFVNKSVKDRKPEYVNNDSFVQLMTDRAEVILTTAVLSIIMTAPLFAVLMSITGKLWLTQEDAPLVGAAAEVSEPPATTIGSSVAAPAGAAADGRPRKRSRGDSLQAVAAEFMGEGADAAASSTQAPAADPPAGEARRERGISLPVTLAKVIGARVPEDPILEEPGPDGNRRRRGVSMQDAAARMS